MNDLLAVLLLLSLLSIPVGLINPRWVLWWAKTPTRGRAFILSVSLCILFLALYVATAPSGFQTTMTSDQLAMWTRERIESNGTTPTYKQLARDPDEWQGKPVKLTGQVVQVVDQRTFRVAITKSEYGFWSDAVVVVRRTEEPRILEDDIVRIWGIGDGLQRYTAIFGQAIEVPRVAAVDMVVVSQ